MEVRIMLNVLAGVIVGLIVGLIYSNWLETGLGVNMSFWRHFGVVAVCMFLFAFAGFVRYLEVIKKKN